MGSPRSTSLRVEYLHKSFGILLYGRLVHRIFFSLSSHHKKKIFITVW